MSDAPVPQPQEPVDPVQPETEAPLNEPVYVPPGKDPTGNPHGPGNPPSNG